MPFNEEYINLRFEHLEDTMEEIKKELEFIKNNQKDPKIYVAIFSLIGVMFATLGSILGTVITAVCKANGWF